MSDGSSGTTPLKTARDLAADDYVQPVVSNARRNFMLFLFCTAQFVDVFLSSCLFPAIPTLATHLHMKSTEIAWILAAYSTTFSAFMLISGRVSDVYSSREFSITHVSPAGIILTLCGHIQVGRSSLALLLLGLSREEVVLRLTRSLSTSCARSRVRRSLLFVGFVTYRTHAFRDWRRAHYPVWSQPHHRMVPGSG